MKKNKSKFIVVSFSIPGYPEAKELIRSLDRFDIDHNIQVLNDKAGAAIKYSQAIFIKKMLKKYAPRPVIWMDPEMIIKWYPGQFDVQVTHIALYVCERTGVLNSSTVYFSNSKKANQILDLWIEANENRQDHSESENLRRTLVRWLNRHPWSVGMLPPTYSIIQ